MTKRKKQARPRFKHVCRNGHVRTEANTYHRPGGGLQCKDCPGYQRKRLSTKQRRLLDAGLRDLPGLCPPAPALPDSYRKKLTPDDVAYLRSLIPCVVCKAPFGEPHDGSCVVPFNVEDDGTAEPSRKSARAA